jgi:ATP synthase protein I
MAESDPSDGPELPRDARLHSLDERLKRAQAGEAVRSGKARRPDSSYWLGQRVIAELIGPPFGGGLIGWLLDGWLGTSPWLLLALLFLGFGIGFRNIVRLSKTPPDQAGR